MWSDPLCVVRAARANGVLSLSELSKGRWGRILGKRRRAVVVTRSRGCATDIPYPGSVGFGSRQAILRAMWFTVVYRRRELCGTHVRQRRIPRRPVLDPTFAAHLVRLCAALGQTPRGRNLPTRKSSNGLRAPIHGRDHVGTTEGDAAMKMKAGARVRWGGTCARRCSLLVVESGGLG